MSSYCIFIVDQALVISTAEEDDFFLDGVLPHRKPSNSSDKEDTIAHYGALKSTLNISDGNTRNASSPVCSDSDTDCEHYLDCCADTGAHAQCLNCTIEESDSRLPAMEPLSSSQASVSAVVSKHICIARPIVFQTLLRVS